MKKNLSIPIAIVIAGLIVSAAIFITKDSNDTDQTANVEDITNKDTEFRKCLESGRNAQKVEDDLKDAINSGGQGTPYSIIINDKGEKAVVSGAYPYEQLKSILDMVISGTITEELKLNAEGPRPVDENDHILGNPDAPITIIEFSDTECPFCKRFHNTMQQIMDEYGKDGKVKWVYRHFPLDQLHSKARKEAEATECAAELGGNEKFWEYINKLYEITPSNDGLDPKKLFEIAQEIGLN